MYLIEVPSLSFFGAEDGFPYSLESPVIKLSEFPIDNLLKSAFPSPTFLRAVSEKASAGS